MRSHTGRTSRDACTAVAILNSSPSRSRPLEHRRRGSPSEINRQRKNSARVRPYFPQIVLLAGPIFCLCVCVCLCVPERRPKFGSKTKRGKRLREIVDLGGLPWGGGFQHSGSYPIVVFQHSEVAHKRQKAGHAFRLPSRSRRLPQRSEHLTNLRGWRTNLRPPRLINQSPKTKRCLTARTTATRSCLAQRARKVRAGRPRALWAPAGMP